MDYKESLDYLYSQLPMFSRIGAAAYKPGLDTSLRLDDFFGNPHRKFRSIHIAGTNGKGSCSSLIAAMLQAQGYKTALYTSPHLVDFRERIRIDGKMIPKEDVVDFVERFRSSGYEGHPSFFELTMMMAFDYFARSGVDYAVIEVGMGGRLDSTNIITPEACLITNISEDHMQFLGDTLEKIAGEKAGIIKPGIPVVIGERSGVGEVFAAKAAAAGAPVVFAEDTDLVENIVADPEGGHSIRLASGEMLHTPLSGDYQKANIRTVATFADVLRKAGIEISDDAVARGFDGVEALTGFRGRWTVMGHNPLVVCDTGHNRAGILSNSAQIRRWQENHPGAAVRMVVGFVADKDVRHILSLFPKDAVYYFTQASIPRAMNVCDLASLAEEAGLHGRSFGTVGEAFDAALSEASPADLVFVGGSTFVVADYLASRGE